MQIKVLAIAPYPGLKGLIENIAKEEPRIKIDIEVADLHNALPIVHAAKGKYDVILSRGGTSTLIKSQVTTPVVDIPVSGYDILRVLTLVKNSNSKVAIIGFPNICRGVAEVSSLLDYEIPIYSVDRADDVPEALQKAFEKDAQIVLGDVVTVNTAEQMGYNGILITSGRESVLEALEEVKRIYEFVWKAQESEHLFEHILEHHRTGVMAVNESGGILYANEAAASLLGYNSAVIRGMNLAGIDPIWSRYLEEAGKGTTSDVNKQTKWFQKRQVSIEIIVPSKQNRLSYQYFIYLYPSENQLNSTATYNFQVTDRIATFAQVMGSSSVIMQAIKRAKAMAQTRNPIWISGEEGSGKQLFCQAIHSASESAGDALYIIPCEQLSEEEQEAVLLGTDDYPGLLFKESVGTICLENIQHISQRLQRKLLSTMKTGTNVRLIVTTSHPIKLMLKKEEMEPTFVLAFMDMYISLPPLRERLEDIDEIARVLIANYNSRHGKQIVGIRQEVLEDDLMHKLWPGNIHQLRIVLESMLACTNGHYIGLNEAKEGWQKVKESLQNEASSQLATINLSGTWDEIEQRILLEILEKEGMNQSKAAKRLGINRSTLWRKLKDVLQI
ncbi:PrpR N-terminal domain-containing protein [Paenibacillus sp. CGMCC 1.16610]|uniref:PAS domain-containing protein n=1 Tax=Paenibacillus anseongense TaxID=2682845 RepID=A0ABW9UMK7_9BACL|nr:MULTISPECIES: PrpR N-terminal domain-containing protein [Paenibacillus]MBA2941139.1 PrpR N-terminal domain-containing protein [Paenibacillus sp. CGMCC 1.16610]MVQ39958.1 PAS domain-containing protein [Paenibacillus anseongense]